MKIPSNLTLVAGPAVCGKTRLLVSANDPWTVGTDREARMLMSGALWSPALMTCVVDGEISVTEAIELASDFPESRIVVAVQLDEWPGGAL